MEEKRLQDIIKNNQYNSQKQIANLLKIPKSINIDFVAEDQFPNSVFVDFTIVNNLKVYGLIETKGSDITVTDFIRGYGQVNTYSNYVKSNISLKNYDLDGAKVIYLLPHDVIINGRYNIGDFLLPENCIYMEYNDFSQSFRIIPKSEINKIKTVDQDLVACLCHYYIRDTRIFEIYLGLKYVQILYLCGKTVINRKEAEGFLRQLNVPDNRNWRNVFISLSSLNFIDSDNVPTDTGSRFANLRYEEFAYKIYESYINLYFSELIKSIKEIKNKKEDSTITLDELKENIDSHFGGKEVLFLTDSNKRYISSWLNIMRDDYGCIDFEARKEEKDISIIYDPSELNERAFCSKIKEHSIAYDYIKKFNELVSGKQE